MTPRTIRRAAERKAAKLARKAEQANLTNPISPAQQAANQANGCGRDAGCPAPPAQIRTSGIPAYGSYLG